MTEPQNKSLWTKSFTLKEQAAIIKRLLPYAARFKQQFLAAVVAAGLLSVLNVLLPRMLQYYMDHVLTSKTVSVQLLLAFAALYFLGTIIKAIMQFIQSFAYSMGAERSLESIRVALFAKLQQTGMAYFDRVPAGSIVSRVTNDTKTLYNFWMLFLTLLVTSFSVISALIAMWLTNRVLTCWILLFLPLLLLVIFYYQKYSSRIYRRMRELLSQINAKLNEDLIGIDIIQQFRQERRTQKEFEQTNEAYFKSRISMIKIESLLLYPVVTLMFLLAEAVVLADFGFKSQTIFIQAGVIYAFISYLQSFFNPMTNVMNYLTFFQDGMVAGSRIIKIMDEKELSPVQNENSTFKITQGKIEFKHVWFSYDSVTPVLQDISFTVNPGQTVAFVGHTGSGKSSTINTLMRFYEFQSGQIQIDGHDIRQYSQQELRQKIGLVLQEPYLFYGDIASNIRMFNQKLSDLQIKRAAEFVQADKFIAELPKGYQQKVSERGTTYSAGQRQLLAFARTIVRDPKILILDEATANLDTQTEKMIQQSLEKMRKNRTTLIVAHRLSTIQSADLILVLDHGKIIERGTHQQLLAMHGHYYEMYRLQHQTKDQD
mgnify:CR=1 FL=1